jgi:hypothetical protein
MFVTVLIVHCTYVHSTIEHIRCLAVKLQDDIYTNNNVYNLYPTSGKRMLKIKKKNCDENNTLEIRSNMTIFFKKFVPAFF